MTETNEQYAERMDKIDDLYACIEKLVKWGYKELAFKVRVEADQLIKPTKPICKLESN
jgi:hypothetical protein